MKLIQTIVFCGNVLLLLGMDLYLWYLSWYVGVGGLVGIVGFFVGYYLSDGMTIARRDHWRLPKYGIFKRKLACGNSVAGTTTVVASLLVYGLSVIAAD